MSQRLKRSEVPIPAYMSNLPLTDGGYLKPWFVKADDFRVTDGDKAALSVTKQACWICGGAFAEPKFAMVGDALSAAARIYREPPCHVECAEYAMQVCPFILYPNAKRREAGLDFEDTLDHGNENASVQVAPENPGEFFISVVSHFDYHPEPQVTAFDKPHVLELQHWVGGERQSSIPEPIIPLEKVPPQLRERL